MVTITSGWWIIAPVCVTEAYFNWVDRRARIICNRPFYNDIRCQTTCIVDNSTVGLFSTSIRRWATSAGGQYCRIANSLVAFQGWNVNVQQKINAVSISLSGYPVYYWTILFQILTPTIFRFFTATVCVTDTYLNRFNCGAIIISKPHWSKSRCRTAWVGYSCVTCRWQVGSTFDTPIKCRIAGGLYCRITSSFMARQGRC